MKTKTLHALANIPSSSHAEWKYSIFLNIVDKMQELNHAQLIVEAVQSVPVLLLDVTLQPSSILRDIFLPTLDSDSEMILSAVSEMFTSVVCVLSGDIAIARYSLTILWSTCIVYIILHF